ncbi:MAG: hypothetical protein LBU73_06045, partial [Helicobacteraceae bacterium]|nr:hypothetical protein [Helicobacteraceae bacterium]
MKTEEKESLKMNTGAAGQPQPNRGVILNPYKGINFYNNDILFGMTQKDVKKILKENAPKIEI